MSQLLKLPVGIENFQEIRSLGFYYVDKTKLIEQLLDSWGKVNLFTRPRRFGKTLTMSMLRYFFEAGTDPALFDGLYISGNRKLCSEYMGRFPVIFLSLKSVDGIKFDSAKNKLVQLIGREADRFQVLKDSDRLSENDKERLRALTKIRNGQFVMDDGVISSSLHTMSELLCKHYGQKTVILIDEYDVPLDKAFQNGYYREMVSLIRDLFGLALKTNDCLQFAVLTGCLRVSKESIFTGLNNFKVMSVTDTDFDEQFGFTEAEVKDLLAFYHLESQLSEMKEWYDGYRFGSSDIYCPWDVINHVDRLKGDPNVRPQAYWINSSGNDLVKRFIDKANKTTRDEIEQLISEGAVEKLIRTDLTYDELDSNIDNLWSVLFMTGYLTQTGITETGAYLLVIPNKEVREVYKLKIREWFKKKIFSNTEQLTSFWSDMKNGEAASVEKYLNRILSNSISVFDTKAPDGEKENSYHTLLVGLLAGNDDWLVRSNREAGEGFADIIVEPEDPDAGIVLELKYTKEASGLDAACRKAMNQIRNRGYVAYLTNDGRNKILFYGIAFHKKRCRVTVEKYGQA